MNTYYFNNRQKKIKLGKELKPLLEKCCDATLKLEGAGFNAEISITFVSDGQIRVLNMENRGIDSATDVLSFPLLELEGKSKKIKALKGEIPLGDIVISLERAEVQAEEYGHSFFRECGFLTVHSMLHLLGYDHMKSSEEKIMNKKCEGILKALGLERLEK